MSLKAVHRILDLIDTNFDTKEEINFFQDTTLSHYKISSRKICLIIENIITEGLVKGLTLKGNYDEFKVIQDNPRLTFKGMKILYAISEN